MLPRSSSFVNRSRLKIIVFVASVEGMKAIKRVGLNECDDRLRYIEMELGTDSDD